jgi:hypothetical protein
VSHGEKVAGRGDGLKVGLFQTTSVEIENALFFSTSSMYSFQTCFGSRFDANAPAMLKNDNSTA